MTSAVASPEISEYANRLANACTGIGAIWLIGSRANGVAKDASDIDLLVWGDALTLECLMSNEHLHRNDVDCLVLVGVKFENAWGKRKSLSLADIAWEERSASEALYTEAKWSDREGSTGVVSRRRKAVRVWGK